MANNTDCGDDTNYNPKQNRNRLKKRGKKIYELGNLPNPIPAEVRDVEELKKFYQDRNDIVPFAGTNKESGDSLLSFILMLATLSPTAANCIGSIKEYSFGGGIDIQLSNGPFAFREKKKLDPKQKEDFISEVIDKIKFEDCTLDELGPTLYQDGKSAGNEWVEVRLYTVGGQRMASIARHDQETVRYKRTEKREQRFVYVSPKWDLTYLEKNEPDLIPLYPAFADDGSGVLRTMIHHKIGKNTWYGRPSSMGSLMYQYREFQDEMYLIKQAANNFTGQLIIEAEDDDPEETDRDAQRAGFDNEAHRLEENFTNKGDDSQSIFYTVRPYGSRPLFVFQVKPNTNENWYKVTGDIAEAKIIASFNWSKRLMYDDMSTGWANDVFISKLKSLLPVIRSNQLMAESPINKAIGEIIKWLGLEEKYKGYGIKYYSPYRYILEQEKEVEDEPDNGMGSN